RGGTVATPLDAAAAGATPLARAASTGARRRADTANVAAIAIPQSNPPAPAIQAAERRLLPGRAAECVNAVPVVAATGGGGGWGRGGGGGEGDGRKAGRGRPNRDDRPPHRTTPGPNALRSPSQLRRPGANRWRRRATPSVRPVPRAPFAHGRRARWRPRPR